MISHIPDCDDEVIATISPAVYFAPAWVVGTVVVVVVVDWLEQPARNTQTISIRPRRRPYRFVLVICIAFGTRTDKNLAFKKKT